MKVNQPFLHHDVNRPVLAMPVENLFELLRTSCYEAIFVAVVVVMTVLCNKFD